MLVIFHWLSILLNSACKMMLQGEDKKKILPKDPPKSDSEKVFARPVSQQRYEKVYEFLIDQRWRTKLKKIVDFGCANLGLYKYVEVLGFIEVIFVDIDEDLLKRSRKIMHPNIGRMRQHRRNPMKMSLQWGSATEPDWRLRDADTITAMELIEHMYPDTLEAFTYNVFGYIKPKLAIFSTPNVDYNILFPDYSGEFRHPDHKFEWSREQFQDWAGNLIVRFCDYTVEFHGVGEMANKPKCFGCCTQIAVFIRKDVVDKSYKRYLSERDCTCDKNFPCVENNDEAKQKCCCMCDNCTPISSVGICMYMTLSKSRIQSTLQEYARSHKSDKMTLELLNCNSFFDDKGEKEKKYQNDYYKCVDQVVIPFIYDDRTDEEKILDTVRNKISLPKNEHCKERECNIELFTVTSSLHVTDEEICKILQKHGYKLCSFYDEKTMMTKFIITQIPAEGVVEND